MSQASKRKRTRKAAKEKDSLSRQTSLWDAFGLKASGKNTPTASAAPSEDESAVPDDIIELNSSDYEPAPRDSSIGPESVSPHPANTETLTAVVTGEHVPGGSKDIPILVPDSSPVHSPVRPRKPLPQHPPKPLYSIFAPKRRPDEGRTTQESQKRVASTRSNASLAPFPNAFMQHVRGPQSVFVASNTAFLPRIPRDSVSEPGVTFDYSQLARGRTFHATHNPVDLQLITALLPDAGAKAHHLSSLPAMHRQFPAISRFSDEPSSSMDKSTDGSTTAHQLWNDKWRPRRADQVLGNERSALYLRDWLLATKLHIAGANEHANGPVVDRKGKRKAEKSVKRKGKGLKRPRVIREVTKKRRRERESSWIAADSSDDDEPLSEVVLDSEADFSDFSSYNGPQRLSHLKDAETDYSTDDPLSSPPPLSQSTEEPPSQRSNFAPPLSYKPPKFGDTVFNTILLSGPHGCGKTAAVYACAEELGWDVFEVYPGIGERSGAALSKLIGEVGKNHLVKSTRHQSQPPREEKEKTVRPKRNFFVKRILSDDEEDEAPSDYAVPTEPKDLEPEQTIPEVMSVVNQSIILVEEVDVLYKEDTNFWPALSKIIKECRRPVVLTCSDTSLIPFQDLPLQTTLEFESCPAPLAASYLQALSLAENRLLNRDVFERLYENDFGAVGENRADSALHPDHIFHPIRDLRRAVNCLQLGVTLRDASPAVSQAPADIDRTQSILQLKRMVKCTEFVSFADSELRRPGKEVLRDILAGSASPSADDPLGFTHLVASPQDMDTDFPVTLSTYHWDEAMVDDIFAFAQMHYPAPAELRDPTPHLHPLHAPHCGTMLPVLDKLWVPRAELVRDARAIFVDYEPWIRYMARVDDAHVAQEAARGQFESTRRTRNSQQRRTNYVRYLRLQEPEVAVVRRTGYETDIPGPEIPLL